MTDNGAKTERALPKWAERLLAYLKEKYKNVNWFEELLYALGIIIRIIYTALAFVLDVIITLLLICAVTGIIVVTAFAVYINNNIDPTFDDSLIITSANQSSQLYYMDYEDRENRVGTAVVIDDQVLAGEEYSIWANYTELPDDLINAFIAVEDERFWSHGGVDWYRTVAAAANQILHIKETFGGSTITQQLVKNTYDDDDFTIQRKVREILRAINLESTHSKEEIITMYLNIISFSQNCIGVQSAAHTYFGKDVSELSLIECAALASIPKSPYKYDPIRNPEYNTERRRVVLDLMLKQGKITQSEHDEVYYQDLVLNSTESTVSTGTTSWYTDAVINDFVKDYSEKYGVSESVATIALYTGGFNIYTVMDPEIQDILEDAYLDDETFPKGGTGLKPQSSAIVIDPSTGDILGLVGGRGEKTQSRILNRATQSLRPCGSSIKPLSVYGPGIEAGVLNWGTVLDDVPVNFGTYEDVEDAKAWPRNSNNRYNGLTTVYDAVRNSTNTISVRALQLLGIDESFKFLKEKCHLDSLIEHYENSAGVVYSDKAAAPLALGQFSYGVTLREMTAAYQIFANKGVYNEARTYITVTDTDGNVVLSTDSPSEIVISEQTADIMTKLMEAVVDNGTAKSMKLKEKIDVAGKTGTTTANFDKWFIGYTPYYLCGVWFGYDLNQTLADFSTYSSVIIWDNVMTKIHEKIFESVKAGNEKLEQFEDATGVVKCTYCKDSGKLMTEACKLDPRGNRAQTGYFTVDTAPTESCDCHVIVNYDKKTEGVASQYCKAENIVQYGLIKVEDRSFPIDVKVTDAQYVYRELPKNVAPSGWWGVSFFANMLKEDEFCGHSGVDKPFNRFCYQHYDYDHSTGIDTSQFGVGETTSTPPPETTTKPPETETDPPETSTDSTSDTTTLPPEETTAAPPEESTSDTSAAAG